MNVQNASTIGSRQRAFSLVELLVVIGIIALLIGILMPVLNKVRVSANRTACAAQLRDIGNFFQMYLNDSKNRLPRINTMPSVQPPINDAPSLIAVLQPYHKDATRVFECRSDRIRSFTAGAPAGFETYYEREGSSYQYDPNLSTRAGSQLKDHPMYQNGRESRLVIMMDYEAFHVKPGKNYLFADTHVGDIE